MHRGVVQGIMAYALWGLLPVFWKLLDQVPAAEILSHRIVWSLGFFGALLLVTGRLAWIAKLGESPRTLIACAGASLLLTFNWGLYIWAVNAGFVVETSLGYFINPLISVTLGVLVLKERLRRAQWTAIAVATIGVVFLSIVNGHPPWISLALAVSFAFYGLLKKQTKLPALEGLSLETAMIVLPALAFLIWLGPAGESHFTSGGHAQTALLVGAGAATATPLLFFAAAARRIPLSLLGVLQYLAPTIQFLLGVLVYGEDFDAERFAGFAIIWIALVLFAGDAVVAYRGRAQAAVRTRQLH